MNDTEAFDGEASFAIHFDDERCYGHGRCHAVAPELFGLDDDEGRGVPLMTRAPASKRDAARMAVSNCPERAITLGPDEAVPSSPDHGDDR